MKAICIICMILILIVLMRVYQKNNTDLTVIILSYNRPENVEEVLSQISHYDVIDEIVVLHGNKDTYVQFDFPKVKNVKDFENNDKYGAARRWLYTDKVKSKYIFTLDDDILPSEEYFNKSLEDIKKNSHTIIGSYARTCDKNGYRHEEDTYNVILTGCSIIRKDIFTQFLNHEQGFKKYEDWYIKHKGNCEDLSLNRFVISLYGEKPIYVDYPYEELNNDDGYSSSSEHYKIRNEFSRKHFSKYY